jgi:hypothetical protein
LQHKNKTFFSIDLHKVRTDAFLKMCESFVVFMENSTRKYCSIGLQKCIHQYKNNQSNTFVASLLAAIAAQETLMGSFLKVIQGFLGQAKQGVTQEKKAADCCEIPTAVPIACL